MTGAIDAGGGFQNYPDDYAVIQKLSDDGQLTTRVARRERLVIRHETEELELTRENPLAIRSVSRS